MKISNLPDRFRGKSLVMRLLRNTQPREQYFNVFHACLTSKGIIRRCQMLHQPVLFQKTSTCYEW